MNVAQAAMLFGCGSSSIVSLDINMQCRADVDVVDVGKGSFCGVISSRLLIICKVRWKN